MTLGESGPGKEGRAVRWFAAGGDALGVVYGDKGWEGVGGGDGVVGVLEEGGDTVEMER